MRINSNMMSGMDTLEQTSRAKNVEKVSAEQQQASTVESDNVTISEKGKDVSEMTRTLKSMPEVRADKIADLKERIAKRFGSLWIRQASHFSGKLSNSFKRAVSDTILFDTLCPLLESHKGLCRETVYREQLIFLPHTSDN